MTVIYTPIGYGVTDENGQCTLDHDVDGNPLAHSYTGSGAGKVDLVASLDDVITESSLVSETYEIIDALFYDKGTTGTVGSGWVYNSFVSAVSNPNGTTVTSSSSSTQFFTAELDNTTTTLDFTAPFVVEFTLVSNTNGGLIVWASGQVGNKNFTSFPLTSNNKIKIIVETNQIRYFCDGVELTPISVTSTLPYRVGFTLYDSTSEIVFKDFKIYPI